MIMQWNQRNAAEETGSDEQVKKAREWRLVDFCKGVSIDPHSRKALRREANKLLEEWHVLQRLSENDRTDKSNGLYDRMEMLENEHRRKGRTGCP